MVGVGQNGCMNSLQASKKYRLECMSRKRMQRIEDSSYMAGLCKNLVQFFSTGRDLHWEFLRLWTGFELPAHAPISLDMRQVEIEIVFVL
jgi:hypothetical protein